MCAHNDDSSFARSVKFLTAYPVFFYNIISCGPRLLFDVPSPPDAPGRQRVRKLTRKKNQRDKGNPAPPPPPTMTRRATGCVPFIIIATNTRSSFFFFL